MIERNLFLVSLRFSPNGGWLCAARDDATIMLWRFANGHLEPLTSFDCGLEHVYGIAFHPSEPLLAVAGEGRGVPLFSLPDGLPAGTLPGSAGDAVTALVFAPDGDRLVSAGDDGVVRVHDWRQQTEVFQFAGGDNTSSLVFHPLGRKLLATCAWQGGSKLRFATLAPPGEASSCNREDDILHDVDALGVAAWSPDGRWIAFSDNQLHVCDPTARTFPWSWNMDGSSASGTCPRFVQTFWSRPVFTPRGALYCGSPGGAIVGYAVPGGTPLPRLEGHDGPVGGLDLHPDGHTLVSTGVDGTLRLWTLP